MQKALIPTCVTLLLIACAGAASAGVICSRIVYKAERGHIVIVAPEGWRFDDETARSSDLAAVIRPAGDQASAATYFYVKIVPKGDDPTLQSFLSAEVERRKSDSPGLHVVVRDHPLPMVFDRSAPVVDISDDRGGHFQAIAFVDETPVYVMLGLSSHDRAMYQQAQAAFAEFVRGYHVSAINVRFGKSR